MLILSHDSAQCMASPELAAGALKLAKMGYWVLAPEHASMNKDSQRPLPSRWGLNSLYSAGDTMGLPPWAPHVADDLAACRYLASRPEVEGWQVLIAGPGIGGVEKEFRAVEARNPAPKGEPMDIQGHLTVTAMALQAAPAGK